MDDTISRQAAEQAIAEHLGIPAVAWIKTAEKWLKDVPSAQQWIPVTEKLPEDNIEVWVTTEMLSEVTRACWHKDSNLWYHPYYSDCLLVLRPIAWMEISLPEPYKGECNANNNSQN